jgi:hypothetical protein
MRVLPTSISVDSSTCRIVHNSDRKSGTWNPPSAIAPPGTILCTILLVHARLRRRGLLQRSLEFGRPWGIQGRPCLSGQRCGLPIPQVTARHSHQLQQLLVLVLLEHVTALADSGRRALSGCALPSRRTRTCAAAPSYPNSCGGVGRTFRPCLTIVAVLAGS